MNNPAKANGQSPSGGKLAHNNTAPKRINALGGPWVGSVDGVLLDNRIGLNRSRFLLIVSKLQRARNANWFDHRRRRIERLGVA
jgi:hypothetical protein